MAPLVQCANLILHLVVNFIVSSDVAPLFVSIVTPLYFHPFPKLYRVRLEALRSFVNLAELLNLNFCESQRKFPAT
jgi:hypothetical protein